MNRADGKPKQRNGAVKNWLTNLPEGRWCEAPEMLTRSTLRSSACNYMIRNRLLTHTVKRAYREDMLMVFKVPLPPP